MQGETVKTIGLKVNNTAKKLTAKTVPPPATVPVKIIKPEVKTAPVVTHESNKYVLLAGSGAIIGLVLYFK